MDIIDPAAIAAKYFAAARSSVAQLPAVPRVVGFIASEDKPSMAYAKTTMRAFHKAGYEYELKSVARLDLESEILKANEAPEVHGIFIYFPVFHGQEDDYLRNLVDYRKDIEAGSLYWTRKLKSNDRLAMSNTSNKKALLPCTPLAIVKLLDDCGEYGDPDNQPASERPLTGKTVTIFNRSEVIGRPLAVMMSNDGALVNSFDDKGPLQFVDGSPRESRIDRARALSASDYVITGVPDPRFKSISTGELNPDTICVNFSSVENFEPQVPMHVKTYIPRVGPMTVAMCMRNTVRLFENFHTDGNNA